MAERANAANAAAADAVPGHQAPEDFVNRQTQGSERVARAEGSWIDDREAGFFIGAAAPPKKHLATARAARLHKAAAMLHHASSSNELRAERAASSAAVVGPTPHRLVSSRARSSRCPRRRQRVFKVSPTPRNAAAYRTTPTCHREWTKVSPTPASPSRRRPPPHPRTSSNPATSLRFRHGVQRPRRSRPPQ